MFRIGFIRFSKQILVSGQFLFLVDCSAEMDIGERTNYNDFRLKGICCDIVLESNEGVKFPAHGIVLRKQTTYVRFCKNRKKNLNSN